MAQILEPISPIECVETERTAEFKRPAKELSDYILKLPLTHEQNDELIELIMNHVLLVEREAMEQGMSIARDIDSQK